MKMQVEWMAFVHVWSRYQALLRYVSPGVIQYYLDVDLEIQLSFIVILSDVLRPNIQRLQDHRANLGINAADGIQMLVFFRVPGISRYVRYVQVGFQTLSFPCIFTYAEYQLLAKQLLA